MLFQLFIRTAQAADEKGQLVTCNGLDCNVCKLLEMVTKIFDYLVYISAAVAILFLVIGGLIYIASRGNEGWMAMAKNAIVWSITGFGIVLLSHLAINAGFKIMGASNSWWTVNCDVGAASKETNTPTKKLSDISNSLKKGGEINNYLAKDTSVSEIKNLISGISDKDLAIFENDSGNQKKPLLAFGKKNGNSQVIYINKGLINDLTAKAETNKFIEEAQADSNSIDTSIEGLSKLISNLLQKGENIVSIVTSWPPDVKSADSFLSFISSVNQCLDSNGSWYRFSDSCEFEKNKCLGGECKSSKSFNPLDGCKCPSNSCYDSISVGCISQDQVVKPGGTMTNPNNSDAKSCINDCGDGVCQKVTCQGSACPCAETEKNCPKDCKADTTNTSTQANFEACVKAAMPISKHVFPQATAKIPDEQYYFDCKAKDGKTYTGIIKNGKVVNGNTNK